jgi:hypothetical protein
MTRKSASERVERFNLRRQGKDLETLRSALTVWAEARGKDIQTVYDGLNEVSELRASTIGSKTFQNRWSRSL